MTVGTGADDVLCATATELRTQLRESIIRELRLTEEKAALRRSVADLECDLADARLALEEKNATINDLRKGWV